METTPRINEILDWFRKLAHHVSSNSIQYTSLCLSQCQSRSVSLWMAYIFLIKIFMARAVISRKATNARVNIFGQILAYIIPHVQNLNDVCTLSGVKLYQKDIFSVYAGSYSL